MKLYYFSMLIIQAFKSLSWGKVTHVHQASNGWAFVIEDILHGDSYVCCAYPVRSQKDVAPSTIDELINMNEVKP